jgi:hypothetical protein
MAMSLARAVPDIVPVRLQGSSHDIQVSGLIMLGGNMRTMPSLDYMGYAVVVNALPAPGNSYYSVFEIHRHVANRLAVQAPASCQQGPSEGVICQTADLAYRDATERARAWIDAHPVASVHRLRS